MKTRSQSGSLPPKIKRFQDEKFVPGSNNGHTNHLVVDRCVRDYDPDNRGEHPNQPISISNREIYEDYKFGCDEKNEEDKDYIPRLSNGDDESGDESGNESEEEYDFNDSESDEDDESGDESEEEYDFNDGESDGEFEDVGDKSKEGDVSGSVSNPPSVRRQKDEGSPDWSASAACRNIEAVIRRNLARPQTEVGREVRTILGSFRVGRELHVMGGNMFADVKDWEKLESFVATKYPLVGD